MGLENPQYLYIMYSKWLESPFPKAQDFLSLLVFNGVSILWIWKFSTLVQTIITSQQFLV